MRYKSITWGQLERLNGPCENELHGFSPCAVPLYFMMLRHITTTKERKNSSNAHAIDQQKALWQERHKRRKKENVICCAGKLWFHFAFFFIKQIWLQNLVFDCCSPAQMTQRSMLQFPLRLHSLRFQLLCKNNEMCEQKMLEPHTNYLFRGKVYNCIYFVHNKLG